MGFVSDNGASEAINLYEANDIWVQHGLDQRVDTCLRMNWLLRVGMFHDSKCGSGPGLGVDPGRRRLSWVLAEHSLIG